MILFVVEGDKEEPRVMATLKQLFFNVDGQQLICSYGTDAYTLWKEVKDYMNDNGEPDVFEIVRERLHKKNDTSLDKYSSYQFESIYLFFDYDPQNSSIPPHTLNKTLSDMLGFFSDPMDKGQIFISYPMTEALYCVDSVPDSNYMESFVKIADCCNFKSLCNKYVCYKNRSPLLFKTDKYANIKETVEKRFDELLNNWNQIVILNAAKSNLICNGSKELPDEVSDVSQSLIFKSQLMCFIPKGIVSILSSYAMFLFEYFHGNGKF